MPFEIMHTGAGTIFDFSGRVTYDEITAANEILYRDPAFDTHRYQLWDFVGADISALEEEEVSQTALLDWAAALSVPRMKVALVALDPLAVELCEHYAEETRQHGSEWECRIFDSRDDALAWAES